MSLSRRDFMAGALALPAGFSRPGPAVAKVSIGTSTLISVSDGNLVLPGSFIFDSMPEDELSEVLAGYDVSREQITPECNVTLLRDETNTVLFDVGSGPDFMPSAGKLVENLEAAGITPQDVTHVVFTHAHPDHIWGLLDDFGDLLFSEASFMMGRDEWDYWWNPETVDAIGEDRAAFAVGARRRMEVIEDMVELFDDGAEILPGLAAIGTYGHTPGHMSFEVRARNEAALIVGDAIGNHHVAFRRPQWPSGSDQDQDLAAETRTRLLRRIADEDMRLVGFHLPDGGIGRAESMDGAYVFVPEDV